MDKLTKEQRHRCMAAIRSKDTKPEMTVRKFLFGRGFRYRLTHKRLPGRPDIVLRRYRTVIFVNGCFWHGHNVDFAPALTSPENAVTNSECCKIPTSNRAYWNKKIMRNKERDLETQQKLAKMGWHCISVWECQLKPKVRQQTIEALEYTLNRIFLEDRKVKAKSYELPEEEYCSRAAEPIMNY
jgi:DNA mismatch endonuclease (patch repair protein)